MMSWPRGERACSHQSLGWYICRCNIEEREGLLRSLHATPPDADEKENTNFYGTNETRKCGFSLASRHGTRHEVLQSAAPIPHVYSLSVECHSRPSLLSFSASTLACPSTHLLPLYSYTSALLHPTNSLTSKQQTHSLPHNHIQPLSLTSYPLTGTQLLFRILYGPVGACIYGANNTGYLPNTLLPHQQQLLLFTSHL